MGCSLAAQGLYVRMMRKMHEAEPYGFFLERNGRPIDPTKFAASVRVTPAEARALISELEKAEVFSRDSLRRIYSRKMVRDKNRADLASELGKKGGNPDLAPPESGKPNSLTKTPIESLKRRVSAYLDTQIPRDTDSLRSSALSRKEWPTSVADLGDFAILFVMAFGNCYDPSKVADFLGYYTPTLAVMRSRASIAEAWQACSDAREAAGGKPLSRGLIKTAISFLPVRKYKNGKPEPVYRTLVEPND
jgi:hypothetical protein